MVRYKLRADYIDLSQIVLRRFLQPLHTHALSAVYDMAIGEVNQGSKGYVEYKIDYKIDCVNEITVYFTISEQHALCHNLFVYS